MKEYEGIIVNRGKELLERLKVESRLGAPVDIVRWINYFSFDFMGDMAYV